MASSSRRSLSATFLRGGRELLGSEEAGLDALGEVDLLLGGEQRDLPDLLQVHAYRVGGRGLEGELFLLLAAGVVLRLVVIHLEVVSRISTPSSVST